MGMSIFGPSIASSVAGAPQAERSAVFRTAKEDRERSRSRKLAEDRTDAPVDQVELTDAVRDLKDNSQEETHEDRKEHASYRSDGQFHHDSTPRLDIEG